MQTVAFHEFLGDLTAILMAFRNNEFRRRCSGRAMAISGPTICSRVSPSSSARRSPTRLICAARQQTDHEKLAGKLEPHALSEVMTGTMFDILMGVFAKHREDQLERTRQAKSRKPSDRHSPSRHGPADADARDPTTRPVAALLP